MRHLIIIAVTFFPLIGYAQENYYENVVLHLIRAAVEEKKLPFEVINIGDSINQPHDVVVIQKTKENGLKNGVFLSVDDLDYRIWGSEELFLYEPYWITPSNIKVANNKVSFDFLTGYLNSKKIKCYSGGMKGELVEGQWILTMTSINKMRCNFDFQKLSE